MNPPINRALAPRLFELGTVSFQELCRAMLRELPNVQGTETYGTNGQTQRGIDTLVTLRTGRRWAGQCKACEKNVRKHLEKAVNEFRPHLEYWKAEGVYKFIVLIGCGLEDTKASDAKNQYKRDFEKLGVEFEVWDSCEIRRHLSGMRRVVEQFLGEWWANEFCGPRPDLGASRAFGADTSLSVPSALLDEVCLDKDEQLDRIRELLRCGKDAQAEGELRALPATESWKHLNPKIRARAFRMLANLSLDRRGDVSEAGAFLDNAKQAFPEGRFVLTETLRRYHTDGAGAALESMPAVANRDEWHLRIALLVNSERNEEARKLLDAPAFEPDAETFRLRAMNALLMRDVSAAVAAAHEAESRNPNWWLVQQTMAFTEYFSAISPAFDAWKHLTWPVPPDWHLIRGDATSLTALQQAEVRFKRLADLRECGSEDWQHAICWQLACVANDGARQAEGAALVRQILTISPASGPAVMWALARNFDFPQEVSRKALAAACDGKTATLDQVQALLSLLTINRDFRNAAELLDRHIALYERSGICDAWCFVRAQMWMAQGDPAKAEAVLAQAKDPEIRARTRVALVRFTAQSQCWTPELAAVLDTEFRRSGSDESLFGACEAHYFAERFDYVADRAEELVRRIGTESTLRLALDATALAKRYELCLELGTHHRTLFRDGTLPQTRLSEANISPSPAARASRVKASSVPRQVTTKHSSQNSNSANDSICPASEASSDWFSTARFPRSGSAIVNHIFGLLNTSYNFSDTSVFTEW